MHTGHKRWNTLFCPAGYWHLNHRKHRCIFRWDKSRFSPTKPLTKRGASRRHGSKGSQPQSHPALSPELRSEALWGQRRERAGSTLCHSKYIVVCFAVLLITWRSHWQATQNETWHYKLEGPEVGFPVLHGKNGKKHLLSTSIYTFSCFLTCSQYFKRSSKSMSKPLCGWGTR